MAAMASQRARCAHSEASWSALKAAWMEPRKSPGTTSLGMLSCPTAQRRRVMRRPREEGNVLRSRTWTNSRSRERPRPRRRSLDCMIGARPATDAASFVRPAQQRGKPCRGRSTWAERPRGRSPGWRGAFRLRLPLSEGQALLPANSPVTRAHSACYVARRVVDASAGQGRVVARMCAFLGNVATSGACRAARTLVPEDMSGAAARGRWRRGARWRRRCKGSGVRVEAPCEAGGRLSPLPRSVGPFRRGAGALILLGTAHRPCASFVGLDSPARPPATSIAQKSGLWKAVKC